MRHSRGDHLLLPGNQSFVEAAQKRDLDVTVDFRPGDHDRGLWDEEVQKVLAWLPGLWGRGVKSGCW